MTLPKNFWKHNAQRNIYALNMQVGVVHEKPINIGFEPSDAKTRILVMYDGALVKTFRADDYQTGYIRAMTWIGRNEGEFGKEDPQFKEVREDKRLKQPKSSILLFPAETAEVAR